MGLDVGRKRIGVAFSDLLGLTAQAHEVWQCRGRTQDVQHLVELAKERDVGEVVLGYPLRTDGTAGPEAEYVVDFKEALHTEAPDLIFHLWDERFTTHEAERSLKEQGLNGRRRRQVVDMAAAALILQSFMERRANRRGT